MVIPYPYPGYSPPDMVQSVMDVAYEYSTRTPSYPKFENLQPVMQTSDPYLIRIPILFAIAPAPTNVMLDMVVDIGDMIRILANFVVV